MASLLCSYTSHLCPRIPFTPYTEQGFLHFFSTLYVGVIAQVSLGIATVHTQVHALIHPARRQTGRQAQVQRLVINFSTEIDSLIYTGTLKHIQGEITISPLATGIQQVWESISLELNFQALMLIVIWMWMFLGGKDAMNSPKNLDFVVSLYGDTLWASALSDSQNIMKPLSALYRSK